MKKTNGLKKGFTLIELIVVIAIIAVLAAVLVPNMIGYVKSSKISTANQTAKTIHTAAAAWVIDANINGETVAASYKGTASPVAGDMDLTDELGADFKGYWVANVSTTFTGVDYVLFCAGKDPSTITHANGPTAGDQWTAKQQKDKKNDGKDIVGCFPLATAAATPVTP